MLVTVSDWGDNKGQRATHSLIKWLTFTASILSLVLLIPLNFSYDIVKIVFLIVTKSRTDKTIQCSVTSELNMQFCNEQTRAQPLFSPPCASATYGSARMSRRKNWWRDIPYMFILIRNKCVDASQLDACQPIRTSFSEHRGRVLTYARSQYSRDVEQTKDRRCVMLGDNQKEYNFLAVFH